MVTPLRAILFSEVLQVMEEVTCPEIVVSTILPAVMSAVVQISLSLVLSPAYRVRAPPLLKNILGNPVLIPVLSFITRVVDLKPGN